MQTELVEALGPLAEQRRLVPGEVLCCEGEESTGAFIVVAGALEAVVDLGGVATTVAEHGPGALVGEVTTVVGGPRTATLQAKGATTVSVLSKSVLSAWLDDNPGAARLILDVARERTDRNRAAALLAGELGIEDRTLAVAMADCLVITPHSSGEELLVAGAKAGGAGVVISGRVALSNHGDRTVDLAAARQRSRGHVIGLEALFGDACTRSAVAVRDSTVGWLGRDDFARLASAHPLPVLDLVRRMASTSAPASSGLGRSVAVLTSDDRSDLPAGEVVSIMVAAIGRQGSVVRLDPGIVDDLLGTSGVARTTDTEPGSRRVEELLHQVEVDHDVVLLHASHHDDQWLDRVVRHADHVVVWSDGPPSRSIETLIARARAVGPTVPVWLALRHRPGLELPRNTSLLKRELMVDEVHHLRADRTGDLERVGRLAAGKGVGLVLSGGGGRGFAHIGAVQSLKERGIPVDRLAGASMGSVIGGAIALGLEGEALVGVIERQFRGLLDYTVPLVSILSGQRIAANITETFGTCEIEDLWIPFGCVTTNLTRNRVQVHRSGSLTRAVRGSVAIPGILPPVPWGEDLLIDGGVLNNLPLDLVTDDPSIGTVVAIDVAPPTGPRAKADFGLSVSGWSALRDRLGRGRNRLPTLASVLMRAMTVGSALQRDRRLASGAADLYLYLDLAGVGLLDFENVRPVADRGYEAADPEIAAWLEATGFEPS